MKGVSCDLKIQSRGELMFKKYFPAIFGAILEFHGSISLAATRLLTCPQTNKEGDSQTVFITLDDNSNRAEVVVQFKGKDCSNPGERSCDAIVFEKNVLPSVIRLTRNGGQMVSIMDIDRKNLQVNWHREQQFPGQIWESNYAGTCSIKNVDTSKNQL
ncbi:hypothetical protein [Burkholderia multivorans]|uniref:hypothetical protein n=1 Tax=Burkholderia multivorans TaxID=87883 RepID=UPI0011B294CB|nr:hypothetical protein [Burkholderia multivorans]